MNELYFLGFKVKIEVTSRKLYVYTIEGADLLEVKGKLIREGIPSAALKAAGRLCVVTPVESSSISSIVSPSYVLDISEERRDLRISGFYGKNREDALANDILMRVKTTILPRLAVSAIRMYLKDKGWDVYSSRKVFNPKDAKNVEPLSFSQAYKYGAFIFSVHFYEEANSHVLFVDPSFKLDVAATLDELLEEGWELEFPAVKLRGSRFSFEFIGEEEDSDFAKKVFTAIQKEIAPGIRAKSWDAIAKVYPRSLYLRDYLLKKNLLREDDEGRRYTLLPFSVLCPLPSLDNLKRLGISDDELKLWLAPDVRRKRGLGFAEEVAYVKANGLVVRVVDTKNIVRAERVLLHEPEAENANGQKIAPANITAKDDWGNLIEPCVYGEELRVALVNAYQGVDDSAVASLQQGLEEVLKPITRNKASVQRVSSLHDAVKGGFNAVVYIGRGNDEDYAKFERSVAESGLIPQYINGEKLARRLKEAKSKRKRFSPRYYGFAIAKGLAFRAGWRYVRLNPPSQLSDALVAGVDRTFLRIHRGVNLGVVPVIMEPDGLSVDYLGLVLGENEEDVIVNAISQLSENREDKETIVLLVNRTHIHEKVIKALRGEFEKGFVCVGVTKTHSLSRILKKGHKESYVNPPTGSCCVLSEKANQGAYLVAASDLKGTRDRTIRPVLVNVRIEKLNVKPREVLYYVLDMNMLNIETPFYPASMPWPLHRADRLCKKLYTISMHTKWMPSKQALALL